MLQKYFKKSTKALARGGGDGLSMSLKVTNTDVSEGKDMGL